MSDHKHFCINEDLFDIIQTTNQEKNMLLKIISNEPNKNYSQCDAIDICNDNICNIQRTFSRIHPVILFKKKEARTIIRLWQKIN